ncbi:hypothetical protein M413DRAFT_25098 [Hebeloma cylindrosporum]|uniref:DNA polymerase delta subunit 3 n=1 Tax=Hebeloma cylindrosporum TaxID=76867 RepID=A0A0C3CKM6_HEBCY|nr:hypothetical protein M413DRAFT_25098 [Hebeloma cylindrosporum h7]
MSRNIADYLSKQILIERNIVTYRSLSRQFGIHVNTAKTELANYHHNGSFSTPDQRSVATFLLSGTPRSDARFPERTDEDYDMDNMQDGEQEEQEDDGEEVPHTQITIVNERDLEEAKSSYDTLDCIHVYSLSPAPLHDAGLLCGTTDFIRSTDKEKGQEFSARIGRVMSVSKKKLQPPPPVAGPSKLKPHLAPESTDLDAKNKPVAVDKPKEKPKPTGKLEFFSKPKAAVKVSKKEVREVKKEESEVDSKKKLFFSKEPSKAPPKAPSKPPSPAAGVTIAKDDKEPPRGVKRKSSVGLETRGAPPLNPVIAKVENASRSKRRVVLSDDESDTIPTKTSALKSRPSFKTVESTDNSEAEREARALMDVDDDEVEKVSRVPSTSNSSINEPDDDDGDQESEALEGGDVAMEDIPKNPATKKRKTKAIIPVGRNGLKKRKVTKTKRTVDANGYIRKEDYSDWESVDTDAEPELPAKPKTKPRVKPSVKKERNDEEVPLPQPVKGKDPSAKEASSKEAEPKKAPVKPTATKARAAGASNSKTQKGKGILNFFGPKKT